LNAKVTDFKLFKLKGNNNNTTVWLDYACSNPSNVNNKGNQSLRAEVRRTATDGGAQGFVYSSSVNFGSTAECIDGNLRITAPNSAFTLNQEDKYGDTYRTAVLRVIKVENHGPHDGKGQKHFRVNYPAGRVSFDDLGKGAPSRSYGEGWPGFGAFALHDAEPGPGNNPETTYTFNFKPDCNHNPGKTVYLKWSDADYGTSNEQNGINWTLSGPNKNVTRSNGQLGGQGWSGAPQNAWPVGKLITEREYTWEWKKVDRTNGVQFWMPFSEGRTLASCPDQTREPPNIGGGCDSISFRVGSGGHPTITSLGKPNRRYAVWVNDWGSAGTPPKNYQPGGKYAAPGHNSPGGHPDRDEWTTAGSDYTGTAPSESGPGGGPGHGDQLPLNLVNDNRVVSGTLTYTVVVYEQYTVQGGPHAGETWRYIWGRDTRNVGLCYRANCSIEVDNNVDGSTAGSNAVKGGEPFDAYVTIHNAGINTLPINLGPNYLSTTVNSWWGPHPYFINDHGFPWQSKSVPPGQSRTLALRFGAPDNVGSHTLSFYPDYWGKFGIGPACPTTVNTYKQYEVNLAASTTFSPTSEDPSQTVHRGTVRYSTWPGVAVTLPYYARSSQGDPPATIFHQTPPGASGTVDFDYQHINNSFPNLKAGDEYCTYISVPNSRGWVGPGNSLLAANNPKSASSCDDIHDRPFLSTYGGDVAAGVGGFYDAETGGCNTHTGGIRAFTNVSGPKGGSGSQLAALSNGNISGFSSASMTAAPLNLRLTFANNVSNRNHSNMGGNFNQASCMSDYFAATQYPEGEKKTVLSSSSFNWAGASNEEQTLIKGNVVLGDVSGYSKRHTLYVEGDVIIDGNIRYKATGWGGMDDLKIPNFTLVVKGNIYIKPNVAQLDGTYIAQPESSGDTSSGNIYTCVNPSNGNPFTDIRNIDNPPSHICNNQLTVVGSLVAERIQFLRTYGTLRESRAQDNYPGLDIVGRVVSSPAAEKIIYTPELYLSPPVFNTPGSSSDSTPLTTGIYEYVTTLPPIL
jgi:hypothetical protein